MIRYRAVPGFILGGWRSIHGLSRWDGASNQNPCAGTGCRIIVIFSPWKPGDRTVSDTKEGKD